MSKPLGVDLGVKDGLQLRRHASIPAQGEWLRSVVTGYFAYHAVPTNSQAICAYRHHVLLLWRRSLERRSQKARVTWAKMDRLAVKTQGRSRMPQLGTYGSVRGVPGNRHPNRDCEHLMPLLCSLTICLRRS